MSKNRFSQKEKDLVIRKFCEFLRTKRFILFAYIFGSFVSGDSFNDIDVGIYISGESVASPLKMELQLEIELPDLVHLPVDVRVMNFAPLSFNYNILKEGTIILDNESSLRADFEGLIYKKYFDFKHLSNEYLKEIANAPI